MVRKIIRLFGRYFLLRDLHHVAQFAVFFHECIIPFYVFWEYSFEVRLSFLVQQVSWWKVTLLDIVHVSLVCVSVKCCSHNASSLLSLIAGVERGSSWTQKRVSNSCHSSVWSTTVVWCTVLCWTALMNWPIISQPKIDNWFSHTPFYEIKLNNLTIIVSIDD